MRILLLTWIVGAILHSGDFALASTVTFGTPDHASNYISNDTNSTPIIYAAIAGDPNLCTSTASNAFCNTCTGTEACSSHRVHENLLLRINFTVNAETANYIYFGIVDGGNFTEMVGYTKSDLGKVGKGVTGYIEIEWGRILDAMGAGSAGVTPVDKNFFVAIAPDTSITTEEATQFTVKAFAPGGNVAADIRDIECGDGKDGVCSFVAGPGDEKAYIDPIEPSGSYPTVDNVPVKFLRLYYSDTPDADMTLIDYSYPYVDLEIDGNGAPDPNKVEGLENGRYYGFKAAIVDEAYNVSLMTSNNQITGAALDNCTATTVNAAGDAACVYITKPSNVIGLLPEDVNCFISTAAFGSSMASKVQDFRRFRNRILLQSEAGAALVKYYYSFGPKAAKFIHDHPLLKPVARVMLWPMWAYSMASLKFGLGPTLLAFFICSLSFAAIIVWGIIKCAAVQRPA